MSLINVINIIMTVKFKLILFIKEVDDTKDCLSEYNGNFLEQIHKTIHRKIRKTILKDGLTIE